MKIKWLWLLAVPSLAWSYDGSWAVNEKIKTHRYEVFNVSRDTLTIEVDAYLGAHYYLKEQAEDMAEALNQAHERRIKGCSDEPHCIGDALTAPQTIYPRKPHCDPPDVEFQGGCLHPD